ETAGMAAGGPLCVLPLDEVEIAMMQQGVRVVKQLIPAAMQIRDTGRTRIASARGRDRARGCRVANRRSGDLRDREGRNGRMEAQRVHLLQIDHRQGAGRIVEIELVERIPITLNATVEKVGRVRGLTVIGQLGLTTVEREIGWRCLLQIGRVQTRARTRIAVELEDAGRALRHLREIGRASCRGRVEVTAHAGALATDSIDIWLD